MYFVKRPTTPPITTTCPPHPPPPKVPPGTPAQSPPLRPIIFRFSFCFSFSLSFFFEHKEAAQQASPISARKAFNKNRPICDQLGCRNPVCRASARERRVAFQGSTGLGFWVKIMMQVQIERSYTGTKAPQRSNGGRHKGDLKLHGITRALVTV